ncbi:hypothetical protein VT84_11965 [Gemmata sp. SH-PL17]|uniref:hypothetical protein n=1 Tax=Gemmata sp. SH-PL17 TaxID=1630693 RepID=UPI00078D9D63|nr:hypothetical protein [Gemmata sp. SH-PL17]AMV25105.1 hypothetical protein VT84_11965 [Gemmata sp. SH-PL17]
MTEADWLACEDPSDMLDVLFTLSRSRAASDERYRQFAIACCRRVGDVLDVADTDALDCLELHAEPGLRESLLRARQVRLQGGRVNNPVTRVPWTYQPAEFQAAARVFGSSAVWSCTRKRVTQAALAYRAAGSAKACLRAADCGLEPNVDLIGRLVLPPDPTELAVQADFLRDIFGNPFRPVAFSRKWRTSTARAVALQMYETREFSGMPILADALQDAGCESAEVLDHCRSEGPHVRGCWVVDLVLGKG